jgi:fructose/tagatose bisphosphate aldolase
MTVKEAVAAAKRAGTAVPAFNIPYLPMVEPIIRAIIDENVIAIVHVARVEWEKFDAKSLEAVAREYRRYSKPGRMFLGLDHVPVIDEDGKRVDYLPIIKRAVDAGYQSVMLDGSRLDLRSNIEATREVAYMAHEAGLACEGEVGAVMGHEGGPQIPYDVIFASRAGFTSIEDADAYARQSGCDWLSVAVGNIHGAVAAMTRHEKKPAANLDIDHITDLYKTVRMPLVLHGGSGIPSRILRRAIKAGIAKINVGTEIRQEWERTFAEASDTAAARLAVYNRVRELIVDILGEPEERPALL